jgi:pimeloyl-ACP methyl ester carboxylesterase
MKTRTLISTVVLASVMVGAGALLAFGRGVDDPADARCNHPAVHANPARSSTTHSEVELRIHCHGADLAGVLTLPPGPGPFPAVVWVHGSGEALRLTWSGATLVQTLVNSGFAVLSYDKRGVGASTGECCPGDDGHFNLLAADAAAAYHALVARPEVDPGRAGFVGASQAGWVVTLAVSRLNAPVGFTALVDAPVVSRGQEELFSRLTGEEGDAGARAVDRSMVDEVREAGTSGFDPLPSLRGMGSPGLWLYGDQDRSQPTALDVEILADLRSAGHPFTTRVFAGADHGLLDTPPSDSRALPTLVRWLKKVT